MRHTWGVVLAVCAASFLSIRSAAQCGEPPSNYCDTARVIPGAAGSYEIIMGVASATGQETYCGVNVGHTVWFTCVPTVSGLLTFTTCHPATTYDTVLEAYAHGEANCEFWEVVACNDDTWQPACSNGCSAWGSTVTIPVTAGVRYHFGVGSYNSNSAGCTLCLGARVTICDYANDPPPVAEITAPAALDCVCDTVYVWGNVRGVRLLSARGAAGRRRPVDADLFERDGDRRRCAGSLGRSDLPRGLLRSAADGRERLPEHRNGGARNLARSSAGFAADRLARAG
jgi:hypothetical protein